MTEVEKVKRYTVGRRDNEGDFYPGVGIPSSKGKWINYKDAVSAATNEIESLKKDFSKTTSNLESAIKSGKQSSINYYINKLQKLSK